MIVLPEQGLKTHKEGLIPIDGIWCTPLEKVSYLPFDSHLGDHRPAVAQFTQESVLGANRFPGSYHPRHRVSPPKYNGSARST